MTIFHGDGRTYIDPVNAPAGTKPDRISRKNAQRYIKWFDQDGYHLGRVGDNGRFMWAIATHCIERGIPYAIKQLEDTSWEIRKV